MRDDLIPHYFINGQYRFNRNEIEDWLLKKNLGSEEVDLAMEDHSQSRSKGLKQFSLFRAVHKGGILHSVTGETKEEIIKNKVKILSTSLQFDSEAISNLLLEREEMQSTGLNHGIAIPHTREFLLNGHHDVVTVVCLERPIPYGSLDKEPVHTLFFLFANSDRHHLQLLAKIAHLSSNPSAIAFLKSKPTKDQLYAQYERGRTSISLDRYEELLMAANPLEKLRLRIA